MQHDWVRLSSGRKVNGLECANRIIIRSQVPVPAVSAVQVPQVGSVSWLLWEASIE